MNTSNALTLAESLLRTEFRRVAPADPQRALTMVDSLVTSLHEEAVHATQAALAAGASWREIGRASTLVDDAGILLRQAAALLLGLPAADRAAEQEMVAQALADYGEQEEGDGGAGELSMPETPEPDVWAAAVDRFRRGVRGYSGKR